MLPNELFCRVRRSCIAAIERIISFDYQNVFLPGNVKLPIGEQYKTSLPNKVAILVQESQVKLNHPSLLA